MNKIHESNRAHFEQVAPSMFRGGNVPEKKVQFRDKCGQPWAERVSFDAKGGKVSFFKNADEKEKSVSRYKVKTDWRSKGGLECDTRRAGLLSKKVRRALAHVVLAPMTKTKLPDGTMVCVDDEGRGWLGSTDVTRFCKRIAAPTVTVQTVHRQTTGRVLDGGKQVVVHHKVSTLRKMADKKARKANGGLLIRKGE